MGDCWDYKIQKVQIAWEVARRGLDHLKDTEALPLNHDLYHEQVHKELKKAWELVETLFPPHDTSRK